MLNSYQKACFAKIALELNQEINNETASLVDGVDSSVLDLTKSMNNDIIQCLRIGMDFDVYDFNKYVKRIRDNFDLKSKYSLTISQLHRSGHPYAKLLPSLLFILLRDDNIDPYNSPLVVKLLQQVDVGFDSDDKELRFITSTEFSTLMYEEMNQKDLSQFHDAITARGAISRVSYS